MCNLCGTSVEDKQAARNHCLTIAEQLVALAEIYREFAWGDLKPHGDSPRLSNAGSMAKAVIRELVGEWV